LRKDALKAPRPNDAGLQNLSHGLASRLPALLVEARRAAHTVAFGTHGRRRAGPGETFWQFRHFEPTDTAATIDWRRSAASDHLFVREREWEAAHTVWMWPDMSASMRFRSHLARTTKAERALLLGFAIAELLVQGGERIGLLGAMPPSASRNIMSKLAMALVRQLDSTNAPSSLPPHQPLSRFSHCLLISDFLDPVDEIAGTLRALASQGVGGYLVQITDPAEETLPYAGRMEFISAKTGGRITAERVDGLRDAYRKRLAIHRDELRALARQLEWPLLIHHTDRPAEEALLALHARIAGLDTHHAKRAAYDPSRSGAPGS
jgi:uncharacterized protein (DUF58 family)